MAAHFIWMGVLIFGIFYILYPEHKWYIPWHLVIVTGTVLINLYLGYCPLTVWEEKLRKIGNPEIDFRNSFLGTYIQYILGIRIEKNPLFWITFSVKVASYLISIFALIFFK